MGLQKHMRFEVGARGRAQTSIVARPFWHRTQHNVSAYVARPLACGETFGQSVHDANVEPSEFRKLAEGDLLPMTRDRARAIRNLCM